MNTELARMWKEAVITKFEIDFWDLPGETEENNKKPQSSYPVSWL
jgi:hypothetical protein